MTRACSNCRRLLLATEGVCPVDGGASVERELVPLPAALAARYPAAEPCAAGASGTVYRVPQSGRPELALRVASPAAAGSPAELARMKRELQKLRELRVVGLPPVFEFGFESGVVWLVRELVRGEPLSVRLARGGRVPLAEVLAIAAPLASTLDGLHRAGIVHRDLAPSRVVVSGMAADPVVSLVDAALPAGDLSRYAAPEVKAGGAPTFRSDLYSFGCVLHDLVAGVAPGLTEPPDASVLELPDALRALVGSLLEVEPSARPLSAEQVRRALDPFLPETLQLAVRGSSRPPEGRAHAVGVKTMSDKTQEISLMDLESDEGEEQTVELGPEDIEPQPPSPSRAVPGGNTAPAGARERTGTTPPRPPSERPSGPGRASPVLPPAPGNASARPAVSPPPPPPSAISARPSVRARGTVPPDAGAGRASAAGSRRSDASAPRGTSAPPPPPSESRRPRTQSAEQERAGATIGAAGGAASANAAAAAAGVSRGSSRTPGAASGTGAAGPESAGPGASASGSGSTAPRGRDTAAPSAITPSGGGTAASREATKSDRPSGGRGGGDASRPEQARAAVSPAVGSPSDSRRGTTGAPESPRRAFAMPSRKATEMGMPAVRGVGTVTASFGSNAPAAKADAPADAPPRASGSPLREGEGSEPAAGFRRGLGGQTVTGLGPAASGGRAHDSSPAGPSAGAERASGRGGVRSADVAPASGAARDTAREAPGDREAARSGGAASDRSATTSAPDTASRERAAREFDARTGSGVGRSADEQSQPGMVEGVGGYLSDTADDRSDLPAGREREQGSAVAEGAGVASAARSMLARAGAGIAAALRRSASVDGRDRSMAQTTPGTLAATRKRGAPDDSGRPDASAIPGAADPSTSTSAASPDTQESGATPRSRGESSAAAPAVEATSGALPAGSPAAKTATATGLGSAPGFGAAAVASEELEVEGGRSVGAAGANPVTARGMGAAAALTPGASSEPDAAAASAQSTASSVGTAGSAGARAEHAASPGGTAQGSGSAGARAEHASSAGTTTAQGSGSAGARSDGAAPSGAADAPATAAPRAVNPLATTELQTPEGSSQFDVESLFDDKLPTERSLPVSGAEPRALAGASGEPDLAPPATANDRTAARPGRPSVLPLVAAAVLLGLTAIGFSARGCASDDAKLASGEATPKVVPAAPAAPTQAPDVERAAAPEVPAEPGHAQDSPAADEPAAEEAAAEGQTAGTAEDSVDEAAGDPEVAEGGDTDTAESAKESRTLTASQARPASAAARGSVVPYRAPQDPSVDHKVHGRDFFRARRYREAADAYERATRRAPSDAGAFAGLGASWLAAGHPDRAIAAYQRAVQLQPSVSGFHAALGRAYLRKGDRARAAAAYEKAVELDPSNPAAVAGLRTARR